MQPQRQARVAPWSLGTRRSQAHPSILGSSYYWIARLLAIVVNIVGELEIGARSKVEPFPTIAAVLQTPRPLSVAPVGLELETMPATVAPGSSVQTAKRNLAPSVYFAVHTPLASRLAEIGR